MPAASAAVPPGEGPIPGCMPDAAAACIATAHRPPALQALPRAPGGMPTAACAPGVACSRFSRSLPDIGQSTARWRCSHAAVGAAAWLRLADAPSLCKRCQLVAACLEGASIAGPAHNPGLLNCLLQQGGLLRLLAWRDSTQQVPACPVTPDLHNKMGGLRCVPDNDGPCASVRLLVAQGLRAGQAKFTLKERSAVSWPPPEECRWLCCNLWGR